MDHKKMNEVAIRMARKRKTTTRTDSSATSRLAPRMPASSGESRAQGMPPPGVVRRPPQEAVVPAKRARGASSAPQHVEERISAAEREIRLAAAVEELAEHGTPEPAAPQGPKHELVPSSRKLCNLADLLFSGRNAQELTKNQRKPLRPGKVSPRLHVPDHINKPPYVKSHQSPGIAREPELHDERGMECMQASGKLAAQVLEYAGTLVKPGLTTDEIDKAVHQMIIDNEAYPSPLGYGGFPKSVCTSVNECICHGIPDSRELEDGDIINIDVTVYLNGYHGDTSATFLCGDVDDDAKKLVQVTRECLDRAISICAPGVEYNRIGKTINDHADKFQFGVVRQFVGHGVGRMFHADPIILHFRNNERGCMVLGQTFTIEPMLTIGSTKPVIWSDNWTAVTQDGSLSAQFEHTILITEDGAEILTKC